MARAIAAARRVDRSRMVAALEAAAPFARRANTLARGVGMRACGNV